MLLGARLRTIRKVPGLGFDLGNGWDCCLALGWGYYWERGSGCLGAL